MLMPLLRNDYQICKCNLITGKKSPRESVTAFLWKVFFTLPLNLIRVERYFSASRKKKTVIIPVVSDVHGGQET